jgi:hypothetical protein
MTMLVLVSLAATDAASGILGGGGPGIFSDIGTPGGIGQGRAASF